MQILEVLSWLFATTWSIFTGTPVPGMDDVSFGDYFLAILLIGVSIGLIRFAFGTGGSGTGYRSGSTRNPKISENRKGDEL